MVAEGGADEWAGEGAACGDAACGDAACGLERFGAAVDSGAGGDVNVAMAVVVVESRTDAQCYKDKQKAGEGGDGEWQQQQLCEWCGHGSHNIVHIRIAWVRHNERVIGRQEVGWICY